MKKIVSFTALAMLLLIAIVAFADNASIINSKQTKPYTNLFTMATTTTGESAGPGASTVVAIPLPISNFSCQLLYSGVTPTTSTITLEGSIDGGTTWKSLASGLTTTLAAGQFIDATGKWASQVRMNWSVLTKATGTTTATMKCLGQQ